MATTTKLLKALHGDTFIFTVEEEGEKFVMVVDSGPEDSYPDIKKELDSLDHIDLFVLTHFHEDHSGGLIAWLKENHANVLKVGCFWVNCASSLKVSCSTKVSAYDEDYTLGNLLSEIEKEYPGWNHRWRENICNKDGIVVTHDKPFVQIEIIGPSEGSQKKYEDNYIEKKGNTKVSKGRVDDLLKVELKTLATTPLSQDSEIPNGASIAFVVTTHDGKYMMLGDVREKDVYDYLTNVMRVSEDKTLKLKYVKMSHHGSQYNISNRLLDLLDTENYVFLTDGGDGGTSHPNRITIARILSRETRDKNKHVNLIFNYSLKAIKTNGTEFLNQEEIDDKNLNFKPLDDQQSI